MISRIASAAFAIRVAAWLVGGLVFAVCWCLCLTPIHVTVRHDAGWVTRLVVDGQEQKPATYPVAAGFLGTLQADSSFYLTATNAIQGKPLFSAIASQGLIGNGMRSIDLALAASPSSIGGLTAGRVWQILCVALMIVPPLASYYLVLDWLRNRAVAAATAVAVALSAPIASLFFETYLVQYVTTAALSLLLGIFLAGNLISKAAGPLLWIVNPGASPRANSSLSVDLALIDSWQPSGMGAGARFAFAEAVPALAPPAPSARVLAGHVYSMLTGRGYVCVNCNPLAQLLEFYWFDPVDTATVAADLLVMIGKRPHGSLPGWSFVIGAEQLSVYLKQVR